MLFLVAQTFALFVLATLIGLAAGWLIWGGTARSTAAPSSTELTALSNDLVAAREEAENRASDVARLRRKLKRAVEELEHHAGQLESAEERIATLVTANADGVVLPIEDSALHTDLAQARDALGQTEQAHVASLAELERVGAEHSNLRDQVRLAESRIAALEAELAARHDESAEDVHAVTAAKEHAASLDRELGEAKTVIRETTERVTHLEQQALLWQNEADRLQAVVDQSTAQVEAERIEQDRVRQDLARQHETMVATLRMEASSGRLRTDAAAEHLARLQHELRTVTERSASHLELTKVALADLTHQVAVAHATLSETKPPAAASGSPQADDAVGLGSLPGMTPSVLSNLHELGVSSLVDVAGWSNDDVARISAWLPEDPNVIANNDWVGAARGLLADASVVGSANGA